MATFAVDLISAAGLYNADIGLSDPWCKVSVGRHRRRTRTIKDTLEVPPGPKTATDDAESCMQLL